MIYFLQSPEGGPIKIGSTINLKARLSCHRNERKCDFRVLGVMEGNQRRERKLHKLFACDLVDYEVEWFNPSVNLLHFIRKYTRKWNGQRSSLDPRPNITVNICLPAEMWDQVKNIEQQVGATPSGTVQAALRRHFECLAREGLISITPSS